MKVSGPGLIGGYVGQDLRVMVDTQEAGNGSIIWIMMWYSDVQWKQVIRTSFSTCLLKIKIKFSVRLKAKSFKSLWKQENKKT